MNTSRTTSKIFTYPSLSFPKALSQALQNVKAMNYGEVTVVSVLVIKKIQNLLFMFGILPLQVSGWTATCQLRTKIWKSDYGPALQPCGRVDLVLHAATFLHPWPCVHPSFSLPNTFWFLTQSLDCNPFWISSASWWMSFGSWHFLPRPLKVATGNVLK